MKLWVYILIVVLCLAASIGLTILICNSDMPTWLKVLLLR